LFFVFSGSLSFLFLRHSFHRLSTGLIPFSDGLTILLSRGMCSAMAV
jgi:hypothetical protein